nr:5364_t:CDS:10 [Entrophospora candida]
MYYHYNILHKNYEIKLNETIQGTDLKEKFPSLEELMKNLDKLPAKIREDVRFFGGGLINHNFFFTHLTEPNEKNEEKISSELLEAIEKEFTSLENLKRELVKSALRVRGSGWTCEEVLYKFLNPSILDNDDLLDPLNNNPLIDSFNFISPFKNDYVIRFYRRKKEKYDKLKKKAQEVGRLEKELKGATEAAGDLFSSQLSFYRNQYKESFDELEAKIGEVHRKIVIQNLQTDKTRLQQEKEEQQKKISRKNITINNKYAEIFQLKTEKESLESNLVTEREQKEKKSEDYNSLNTSYQKLQKREKELLAEIKRLKNPPRSEDKENISKEIILKNLKEIAEVLSVSPEKVEEFQTLSAEKLEVARNNLVKSKFMEKLEKLDLIKKEKEGELEKIFPPEDRENEESFEKENKKFTSLLSEEQKKVFYLAVRDRKSIFFTGAAGTGKSFLLKRIIEALRLHYGKEKVAVTALTGIAAVNINGTTLHSFSGIGLGNSSLPDLIKKIQESKRDQKSKLIKLLNEVRFGKISPSGLEVMKELEAEPDYPDDGIKAIQLSATNEEQEFKYLQVVGFDRNHVMLAHPKVSDFYRGLLEKQMGTKDIMFEEKVISIRKDNIPSEEFLDKSEKANSMGAWLERLRRTTVDRFYGGSNPSAPTILKSNSDGEHFLKEGMEEKKLEESEIILLIDKSLKEKAEEKLNNSREEKESERVDVFLPGKKFAFANLHPLTQIIQKIYSILIPLGYQIAEGPEVENEEYNFNKLNMPSEHPARGMHDTFYLDTNFLLRTHTSNTQIRVMEKNPNRGLKIVTAGKVYRRDEDDATHTHQFTQIEGFAVGRDISFSHLKGTLEIVLKELFSPKHPIRFRPSYFPFTEPSVEVDAKCIQCRGSGCNICKKTGWVEILGAGLIHPQVLKNCGFDSQKFTGFAFGLGVERLLMIEYGVEDIRHFYNNDVRFLKQFRKF